EGGTMQGESQSLEHGGGEKDAVTRWKESEGETESPEEGGSCQTEGKTQNTADAVKNATDMEGDPETWSEERWTPPEEAEEPPQLRRVAV
ncbi:hypothetical protein NDU88_006091, partial [Pleurodeles waltl]